MKECYNFKLKGNYLAACRAVARVWKHKPGRTTGTWSRTRKAKSLGHISAIAFIDSVGRRF